MVNSLFQPVPSGDSDGGFRIQIEFKEFGVRLGFTPTIIGDKISLVVAPEVSELDPNSGISTFNITIPGLRTRKATTTVELKNGQSFAIAGPHSEAVSLTISNSCRALALRPILGALMRSTKFERKETELAIIITPYIVEPSDPGELTSPTDYFVRPHELELFFLGKLEGSQPFDFVPRKQYFNEAGAADAVGVDGAVGYIIE